MDALLREKAAGGKLPAPSEFIVGEIARLGEHRFARPPRTPPMEPPDTRFRE